MHESWKPILKFEFEQPYFKELGNFLHEAYLHKNIYPPKRQVFSAFNTDLKDIKVVIIGQDPYHCPHQANGLAFSVNSGVKIPPSLMNIFKEIYDDVGVPISDNGDLTRWAKQGVLLLNNTLTVEEYKPGSHRGKGWETFTGHIIQLLNENCPHLVFILWGADARRKKAMVDQSKHFIIESAHPSPLSAYNGFFGSKPFSKCNAKLKEWGMEEIKW